jgi:hypothetical protein
VYLRDIVKGTENIATFRQEHGSGYRGITYQGYFCQGMKKWKSRNDWKKQKELERRKVDRVGKADRLSYWEARKDF